MASIFIVEDNPDIARLYQTLFSRHETRIAGSVRDAINCLARDSAAPDLVILDFHLPDDLGLVVLDYIRAHPELHDTTVWGISADDLLSEEAAQKGMNRFFHKPLDIPQLLTAIHPLFEGAA